MVEAGRVRCRGLEMVRVVRGWGGRAAPPAPPPNSGGWRAPGPPKEGGTGPPTGPYTEGGEERRERGGRVGGPEVLRPRKFAPATSPRRPRGGRRNTEERGNPAPRNDARPNTEENPPSRETKPSAPTRTHQGERQEEDRERGRGTRKVRTKQGRPPPHPRRPQGAGNPELIQSGGKGRERGN